MPVDEQQTLAYNLARAVALLRAVYFARLAALSVASAVRNCNRQFRQWFLEVLYLLRPSFRYMLVRAPI
jgi:hypothetical protein